ncbi:MAG TPA: sulfite exporter TauE/SafE family protein, partial [Lentzea sp.]
GLTVAGTVTAHKLWSGVLLVPFLIAGFLLSSPLRRRFDAKGVRTPMLVVAGASAVVLIVRSAFL